MENRISKPDVVIYGAGAIGASICGWLTPVYNNVYLLARGQNAQTIKSKGLTLYQGSLANKEVVNVNIIEDLNEKLDTGIVIITVKNYDLEDVAKDIYAKLGDKPIIIALQNGVENQNILPKYFSKVIYGVIMVSAWRDKPGVFGYAVKGYITCGTLDNALQDEMKNVKSWFSGGVKFRISRNIQDAIHTKLIFNLSNSILTLINYTDITNESISTFGQINYKTLAEGIKVFESAGFKEHRLPGLVPWNVIKTTAQNSDETSGKMLLNQIKGAGPNSMTQDLIIRQKSQSELDHLNGYVVNLAKKLELSVPFNDTIYELCKAQLQEKSFKQLKVEEVWEEILRKLSRKRTIQ
jgi:2-dehydropantoate 2-reductase